MELEMIIKALCRMLIIKSVNICAAIYYIYKICGVKRNILYNLGVLILKAIVFNDLYGILLGHYYGDTSWYLALLVIIDVLLIFIVIAVNLWVFDGGWKKVIFATTTAEYICTFLLTIIVVMVSAVQKRENLVGFGNEMICSSDIFIILLGFPVFALSFKFFIPLARKISKIKRLFNIIVSLGIIYIFIGSATCLGTLRNLSSNMTGTVVIYICFLIVVFIWHRSQFKQMEKEYKNQVSMVEQDYLVLKKQLIKNMEMLRDFSKGEVDISYTEELKEEYSRILKIGYCDDLLINHVLLKNSMECDENGIETDFLMHKYDRGNIKERELVWFVGQLLKFALDENIRCAHLEKKQIILHIASFKNQLVIKFAYTGEKEMPERKIAPLLRKYYGTAMVRREGNLVEKSFMLERF